MADTPSRSTSGSPPRSPERRVTSLDDVKAERFLRELGARPFVALVDIEGVTKVYCKGMSEDDAKELMEKLLVAMA